MKKLRSIFRRLLYGDASAYLKYMRSLQGCHRAAQREERWYANPDRVKSDPCGVGRPAGH
jgi:hypothetical protein